MLDTLKKNHEITDLSNFKTKAFAQYFFECKTIDDIDKVFHICKQAKKTGLKVLFIGGGTNMLFAFKTFDGIVIHNTLDTWSYNTNKSILTSYSSATISDIAKTLETEYNQDLWHRFIGLPGSVGGAVFGNAGCFGLEIENNFLNTRALDLESGNIITFEKKDMDFSYRNSIFKTKQKYFIIEACFDLSQKIEKYHSYVDNIYFREHKQPKGNTCGSFFKNPDMEDLYNKNPHLKEIFIDSDKKPSAGFLLESIGYKGKRIKSAFFSELHANFLMSDGNGDYKDLLKLIHEAKQEVQKTYGIDLVPEVRIISN